MYNTQPTTWQYCDNNQCHYVSQPKLNVECNMGYVLSK